MLKGFVFGFCVGGYCMLKLVAYGIKKEMEKDDKAVEDMLANIRNKYSSDAEKTAGAFYTPTPHEDKDN